MSQATDTCIQRERDLWEKANDAKVFGGIFADDAIAVMEPMGFVTKEKAMSMVPQSPWTDLRIEDMTAREVSDDCVVLAYHGSAQMDGKPYKGSVCSTYVKRNGDWQLVLSAHQPWNPETDKTPDTAG